MCNSYSALSLWYGSNTARGRDDFVRIMCVWMYYTFTKYLAHCQSSILMIQIPLQPVIICNLCVSMYVQYIYVHCVMCVGQKQRTVCSCFACGDFVGTCARDDPRSRCVTTGHSMCCSPNFTPLFSITVPTAVCLITWRCSIFTEYSLITTLT